MKQFLFFLLTITYLGVFAQSGKEPQTEHHCGWHIACDLLEKQGKLDAYFQDYQEKIDELRFNKEQLMSRSANTVYEVPVVVHIVWGEPNGINVTDAQVDLMMENLNKDYARQNEDANVTRPMFVPVASSVDIRFCLAKKDPNGNPTTGIVRRQTDHGQFNPQNTAPNPDTGEDIKYTAQGGDDAWDTQKYLNIWIGDLTGGTGAGVVGYSTLPGSHGQPDDGFIMDCQAVAAGNLDRTPTHEIGHYFGLEHPWGPGDPGEPINPQNPDDGFNDTPLTDLDHLGGSCSDSFFRCNSEDQFENFMGYSNCTNMFTIEQAAHMKNVLETTRASLLNDNCTPPALAADFTPNTPTITINVGETVTFTDASTGPVAINSWNWTFQGGTPASANTGGAHTVTYNTAGTFSVSLTVGDAGGDNDTKNVDALVEVIDELSANFNADITYVPIGDAVTFTDMSNAPDPIISWNWDFGDGNTSTDQNPVYTYNALGVYTVSLTVDDGNEQDTETKEAYIEVYDPLALNITDFTGTPTIINIGESVNFDLETNLNDYEIDSIRWIFQGADEPFVYKENTLPFDVTYSTGGIFDVEVRAYRSAATDGDTLIKAGYITVIDPDEVPVANFTASNTSIPVGSSIHFINLTTNMDKVDSVLWTIETAPGVEITSTDINPTNIAYNSIGDFSVKLLVYSPFGDDEEFKLGYVHVFDPDDLSGISANFEAITVRLISVGESVRFEDLSTGDVQNWKYIFDRGAGESNYETVTQQNPEHVFMHAGYYNVTLIASNNSFSDTVIKNNYVVVTSEPWPGGGSYCDTISALKTDENVLTYRKIENEPNWGYFPGHCALSRDGASAPKQIKQYAQKFETYQPDYIGAVLIPVSKLYTTDPDAQIRVRIWNANEFGYPNNIISGGTSSNKVKLSNLEEQIYNYIELDERVEVDSVFFVGFRLDYSTDTVSQDTFATYMAPPRPYNENTLYVSTRANSGPWETPANFFEPDLNTAMGIKLISCIVSVPELENLDASLTLYPNPSTGEVQIDFGDLLVRDLEVEVFDILSKKSKASYYRESDSQFKLDISNNDNGFYLIRMNVDGYQITKKVLLQR